jgi:hypothetical protein
MHAGRRCSAQMRLAAAVASCVQANTVFYPYGFRSSAKGSLKVQHPHLSVQVVSCEQCSRHGMQSIPQTASGLKERDSSSSIIATSAARNGLVIRCDRIDWSY